SPGPASGREPELIRATVGHRQVEPDGPVAEVEADLRAIAGPAVRERRGAVATQGRLDLVAALLGRHGGALGVTRHAETRPLDGPWTTRRYSSLLGKHCAQHASPKTRHCSGLTSLTFWARSTLVHEAPLAYWRCTVPRRLMTTSLIYYTSSSASTIVVVASPPTRTSTGSQLPVGHAPHPRGP